MDLIQLKIKQDSHIIKHIELIKKFDHSLSLSFIKKQIENNDYVVIFDLEYNDLLEDIMLTDRKATFRDLITNLSNQGAMITLYQNDSPITLELLDNWLVTLEKIELEVQRDIEREL